MSVSRRVFTVSAAAAIAAPGMAFAQAWPKTPIIIAHRGASGERPEHTLMGYTLAIAQGADVIEPDLVVTKDRVLVARHETHIAGTTDVAKHPEFASRKIMLKQGQREVEEWVVEDFTLAEYQTLRARERMPEVRPKNTEYDGREAPPTFQQVIDLAKREARRLGRPVGIYPELKQAAELLAKGYDTGAMLLDQLKANGLPSAEVPVFIQSFEPEALKRIKGRTTAPLVQLTSEAEMTTPAALAEIATYARGFGPEKALVTPELVANVHRLGMVIHPWTLRAENRYLPEDLRRGADPMARGDIATEAKRLIAMGVDGLFSDFPGIVVAARG